jgi:hypothetical protein
MTIEQTVDIPVSRRLVLELPLNVPTGSATITIHSRDEKQNKNDFNEFFGIFKGKKVWDGNSVEIIRKMRDEW